MTSLINSIFHPVKSIVDIQNYFVGGNTISTNDGSDPEKYLGKAVYVEGIGLQLIVGKHQGSPVYNTPALINNVQLRYGDKTVNALMFGPQIPAYQARFDHYKNNIDLTTGQMIPTATNLETTLEAQKNALATSNQYNEIIQGLDQLYTQVTKIGVDTYNYNQKFGNFALNKTELENIHLNNLKDEINEIATTLLNKGVEIATIAAIGSGNTKELFDRFNMLRFNLVRTNTLFTKLQNNFDKYCPNLWEGSHWRNAQGLVSKITGSTSFYKTYHRSLNTTVSYFVGQYITKIGINAVVDPTKKGVVILASILFNQAGGLILSGVTNYIDKKLVPQGIENLADPFVRETDLTALIVKSLPQNLVGQSKELRLQLDVAENDLETYNNDLTKLEKQLNILNDIEDPIKEIIEDLKGWVFDKKLNRFDKSDWEEKIETAFEGHNLHTNISQDLENDPIDFLKKLIEKYKENGRSHNSHIDQAFYELKDKIKAQKQRIKNCQIAIGIYKSQLEALTQ